MKLSSPTQVKGWCIENSFHPNRTLGQNFLIDGNTTEAIAAAGIENAKAAGAGERPRILEIGPGLGALTEALLAKGAEVTAVEKDPVLAQRLAAALGSPAALSVVEGDGLRFIEEGKADYFDAMVSNLPYASGTRMLVELALRHRLPSMTALLQTEVAERLAAPEGSRTRSLAGVWMQLDYSPKILRKVSAACFWPRPEVGSTVITFAKHRANEDFGEKERKLFRDLTKRAFAHRRKQLGSIFKDMVKSRARAEELSLEEWTTLTKGLANEDT